MVSTDGSDTSDTHELPSVEPSTDLSPATTETASPPCDDYEPNDTAATATVLGHESILAQLCPDDRVDIYALDVPRADYEIAFATSTELDRNYASAIHLELFAPDGATLLETADSADLQTHLRHTADKSGRYYVVVTSPDADDQLVPYFAEWTEHGTCSLSLCAVDLDGEPTDKLYGSVIAVGPDGPTLEIFLVGENGCFQRAVLSDSTYSYYATLVSTVEPRPAVWRPFVTCQAGEHIELGDVLLPTPVSTHPVEGETTVELDGGLVLHANADHIDWNFEAPELGGVAIPREQWPLKTAPTGAQVLAVWALRPWRATSDPGIAFEIHDTLGLSEGDTVTFWVHGSSDFSDRGELQPQGEGVVEGGMIRSFDGLGFVSWLFVAR